MVVNLAGTNITIDIADRQETIRSYCTYFFNGFFRDDLKGTVSVRLSALPHTERQLPAGAVVEGYPLERLVSPGEAGAWLAQSHGYTEVFPLRDTTICSLSREGMLLYDPETSEGHICIIAPAQDAIHSIHRLLWIYFAQVLGERGGVFSARGGPGKRPTGRRFYGGLGSGQKYHRQRLQGMDGPFRRRAHIIHA